jgi:hypothetical protein
MVALMLMELVSMVAMVAVVVVLVIMAQAEPLYQDKVMQAVMDIQDFHTHQVAEVGQVRLDKQAK